MQTTEASFAETLSEAAADAERMLDACLPKPQGAPGEAELIEAMRYAVMGGGKRLRAFLAMETARLFDAPPARGARVGAAMECLHAYSLVHDDMPCMDDDDLRRGKPTVHKAWNEATAVLAGDALQTVAFEILADPATHPDGDVRARLCLRLAQASGHAGMVGGQAIDLAAESAAEPMAPETVRKLQQMKTGALIEVSAEAGAIVGGASHDEIGRIRAYARALGEAFQIADDLLDVTGTVEEVGKAVGKDAGAGKATFVDILGIDGARARADELVSTAAAELSPFGARAGMLIAAARFVVDRRS
ncbi:polyprenyl synthetase family protein [Limibaculum sp. M0105]|uniref:Geranylgeranyl diphosphate synthase n=1 Tax=Thermohalobaculum xanthum TaxID=2753746 RepID=A0A8J7M3Z0_9RHOB|nr:farnesyl diphosphate synthase [Thermohalobaculum xanthum]MBK0397728.1 polyprenyl synthetase family protein [Thermohalobaculum xanthum]